MQRDAFVTFVRQRGLAVVATRGTDGAPQAALVGVATTESAELIFDTLDTSRKYANITCDPRVAVVIGWDDEITVQCEGSADVLTGPELDRCQAAYFEQYPDGRDRAAWTGIAYVRFMPEWVRYSDWRPDSFIVEESRL